MSKVYISGGINGIPLAEQIFKEAANYLQQLGYETTNPFDVNRYLCPDKTPGQDTHEWECYLRHDIIEMLKCDFIYMLPDWERSRGARLEHFVALQCGLRVLDI